MVVYLEYFSVVVTELKKVALLDHYLVVEKAGLLVVKWAFWKVDKKDYCLVGTKVLKWVASLAKTTAVVMETY